MSFFKKISVNSFLLFFFLLHCPLFSETPLTSVCVFCGCAKEIDPSYKEAASQLGALLAKQHIQLVYGGAKEGLMGTIADKSLENGGSVIGIMPEEYIQQGAAHPKLSQLISVSSSQKRKKQLFEKGDAIIVLPGGLGTMEEFFEVLFWKQRNQHQKPIILVNINHYFDDLLSFFNHIVDTGFTQKEYLFLFSVIDDVDHLLPVLKDSEQKS